MAITLPLPAMQSKTKFRGSGLFLVIRAKKGGIYSSPSLTSVLSIHKQTSSVKFFKGSKEPWKQLPIPNFNSAKLINLLKGVKSPPILLSEITKYINFSGLGNWFKKSTEVKLLMQQSSLVK